MAVEIGETGPLIPFEKNFRNQLSLTVFLFCLFFLFIIAQIKSGLTQSTLS